MLKHTKAFASFSVDDIERAREFYGTTLGLDVKSTPEGALQIRLAGGGDVFVYPSTDYQAPDHTVLNFVVENIDAAIDTLADKGIKMEQYHLDDIETDARGVFRGDLGPKAIAWFKDPAGHILSILELG